MSSSAYFGNIRKYSVLEDKYDEVIIAAQARELSVKQASLRWAANNTPEAPHHAQALLVLSNCGGLQELLNCQSHLLSLLLSFFLLCFFCFTLTRLLHDQTVQMEPSTVSSCMQQCLV